MELDALIAALAEPSAYRWLAAPGPGEIPNEIEVIQTHISVVFLAGDEVIKIHKPVEFGFLDFRTLEQRRRDCEAEVEVNAELAPGVYRGVVAIVRAADPTGEAGDRGVVVDRDGQRRAAGAELVEWAVWMRRLPESATLRSLLARGELDRPLLRELAVTLADFYRAGAERAAARPELARLGDLATVRANVEENFEQLDAVLREAEAAGRPAPFDRGLLERLEALARAELEAVAERIHARWEAGAIRDTHGDLRLDHVYALDRAGPGDAGLVSPELRAATGGRALLIIDRIEFNDRFRWADPIGDVAFLLMDLEARGAWQLASELAAEFIAASDDHEGASLLRFYCGYRATVRAKIAAMAAAEPELGDEARAAMRAKAEARARLAVVEHAPAPDRPCLVLVAGLPGTGKSALARGIHEAAGLTWIRSDVVRKQLAGVDPRSDQGAELGGGLYTQAWSERTYASCLARAGEVCRAGGRALVDATFIAGARREAFVEAAIAWGVPAVLLVVEAPPALVRERLAARAAEGGDPSDADWTIYEAARARWSPVDSRLCRHAVIDASGTVEAMVAEAHAALARFALV